MATLEIKDLHVAVQDMQDTDATKEILRGVDLTVRAGETHAIMGPNGSGKSTLAYAVAGHPKYAVTSGQILLDGQDVLEMTVDEACEFFAPVPAIARRMGTLRDVGLGYVRLGQPATTLSGGEAQRVKLASELGKRATGKTVYILDEPTTGLHFADVEKLLDILHRLVDAGNTVIIIEHNLDVIRSADHVIDLGPDGGDAGGEIVATGTPEEVARVEASHTGSFLRDLLPKVAAAS